jgi:ribosomal protein L39E
MGIKNYEKKVKLMKAQRQTKWAPVWVVLKKFGTGKRVHPSAITRYRRSWRRTKLRVQPIKETKRYLG